MPPRREERAYTSDDSTLQDSSVDVWYCRYCATFALITDVSLDAAPRRKTDGAVVMDETKATFRRAMVAGETKLIKRPGGVERQYRLNCKNPHCNLPLAYRTAPIDQPSKFMYVLPDALTSNPAEVGERHASVGAGAGVGAASVASSAAAKFGPDRGALAEIETAEQREEREYAEEERAFFAAQSQRNKQKPKVDAAPAALRKPDLSTAAPAPAPASAAAAAGASSGNGSGKPPASGAAAVAAAVPAAGVGGASVPAPAAAAPSSSSAAAASGAASSSRRSRSRSRSRDRGAAAQSSANGSARCRSRSRSRSPKRR